MEKIDVFDYIERAATALDANAVGFAHAADKLTEFLETTFGEIDATVGVTSRIKSRNSLKEKILRNNLYKDYPAERLVFEMHDIIGVRIECRFFKDEDALYRKILETFSVDAGDGFFSPVGKKAIRLKLDTPQPAKQKNGFHIYRIDGSVAYAGETYNFELQIKSLVNSFWSEIEHKLIYKNIRFSPADTLMKELLNSIHESLSGVDHQLNLIFDRFAGNSISNQYAQIENMLTLGLNEIYTEIIQRNTGISVSITEYSEAIVKYLLTASSYVSGNYDTPLLKHIKELVISSEPDCDGDDDDDCDDGANYGGMLMSIMEWMRNVDYSDIAIGEKITLGDYDGDNAEIARVFAESINADFHLNTFFHIFFSLERGTDDEDFADYIRYYAERILDGKTQEQAYRTLARLYEIPAHKLPLEKTIELLENVK